MNGENVHCHAGDCAQTLERLPQLGAPEIHVNLLAEVQQLRQQESWLSGAERVSKTLVKYSDFRLVLVAMKAASVMKEHSTEGQISIHSLSGHLRVLLENTVVDLRAGELLALACGIPHGVEALEESVFLLTIAWPKRIDHK